nr:mitochondrial translation elongation factor G [Tanacetum cinerariifolium]
MTNTRGEEMKQSIATVLAPIQLSLENLNKSSAHKVFDQMSMYEIGIVQEYYDRFNLLFGNKGFNEGNLVHLFLWNLHPNIKKGVSLFTPKSLSDAYHLAKVQESVNGIMKKKLSTRLSTSSKYDNSKEVKKESIELVGYKECFKESVNVKGTEMECMGFIALNELEEDCNIEEMKSNRANEVADITSGLIGGGDLCKEGGKDNQTESSEVITNNFRLKEKENSGLDDDESNMCALGIEKKSEDGMASLDSSKDVDTGEEISKDIKTNSKSWVACDSHCEESEIINGRMIQGDTNENFAEGEFVMGSIQNEDGKLYQHRKWMENSIQVNSGSLITIGKYTLQSDEVERKMNYSDNKSLSAQLKVTIKKGAGVSHSNFGVRKWLRMKKIGARQCKFQHRKREFDIWKWQKRKKERRKELREGTKYDVGDCVYISKRKKERTKSSVKLMFCWNEGVYIMFIEWLDYSRQAINQQTGIKPCTRGAQKLDCRRSYILHKRNDVSVWVYPKLKLYRKTSVRRKHQHKLPAKFYVSYQVIFKVGKVVSKLELVENAKIVPDICTFPWGWNDMVIAVWHVRSMRNSSTRTPQAALRNKGKALVNSPQLIYDQEPSMVDDDDDETSKDKEIDKLMALISLSFKKVYKPINNNLRTSSNTSQRSGTVAGARDTVGSSMVQKSGIQCYNCKEYGHVARECQKPKRAKDAAYHREKMLLCKQEEAGIQLNAEQADWRDDTDDESDEQAHSIYSPLVNSVMRIWKLLSGSQRIDNDIYLIVDACSNACEMWKAIKRLKQGESINVQDLETNLFWEFRKFTSLDGESLKSYYSRTQQAATRNRGTSIVNSPQPIYDQETSMIDDDDDETSKDNEIDKLMALISLSFKKIYKPTNNNLRTSSNTSRANQDNSPRIHRNAGYEHQRLGNVAGARETVGSSMVQKTGIQCYNCKEFGHVARECQKPKRAKDAAYHREKMLLYFKNKNKSLIEGNSKLSKENDLLYTDFKKSKGNDEIVLSILQRWNLRVQKLEIKLYKSRENNIIEKVIDLENKVKVLDNIVYKTGQTVQMMNMLNNKYQTSFAKPEFLKKAKQANPCLYDIGCYNDNLALMLSPESDEVIRLEKESRSKLSDLIRPFDYAKLNSLYDLFVPQRKKSSEQRYFSINVGLHLFLKRLNEEMVVDLRYFNSLELEVDSLTSQLETQRTQFVNEIDRLSREYYYADYINAILGVYTELDKVTNLQ